MTRCKYARLAKSSVSSSLMAAGVTSNIEVRNYISKQLMVTQEEKESGTKEIYHQQKNIKRFSSPKEISCCQGGK